MVESILAEEQAGFKKKKAKIIMAEKQIEHGKNLCHNYIDFKKACMA